MDRFSSSVRSDPLGGHVRLRIPFLKTRRPSTRWCIQCGQEVAKFLPYRDGTRSPVTSGLEVIGSDVNNFSCPNCGGFDRERHLLLYFDALGLWHLVEGRRVLHIAPEANFGERVAARASTYIPGDLEPRDPRVMGVDLTSTPFEDGAFDFIIANHVLEHVLRDDLAMGEIERILAPGGAALLQTPFTPRLAASLENPSVTDPSLRMLLFGQEDHVRVYGTDLFDRLAGAGLKVSVTQHNEAMPDVDAARYGVNVLEPLILARKA